jgi:dihydropteroate synthase
MDNSTKVTFTESRVFSTPKTLNIGGKLMDLSVPRVMGILNVTPDSFYDGARYTTEVAIAGQVEKMLKDGATFIDVGGYSSRPGAADISSEEEMRRVVAAIRTITKNFREAVISIDTFRSEVARAAVAEGAGMINDISGGGLDPDMFNTVAALQVPYILMHMRGTPQTMNSMTEYDNLMGDIIAYFHQKIFALQALGVKDIIIDPGFGFAKTVQQNFELLDKLNSLQILGKPLLVGLSRKSMVWRTLGITPAEALNGTTVLHTLALLRGTSILRVHDVKEAVEAVVLGIRHWALGYGG